MNVEIGLLAEDGGEYFIRKYEVLHNKVTASFPYPPEAPERIISALRIYVDGDCLETVAIGSGGTGVRLIPGMLLQIHHEFKPSFKTWLFEKRRLFNHGRYGKRK